MAASETVGIVQARMRSTRLPGKVLADLVGEPVLARVVSRLSRASRLSRVVVATTTGPEDDPIESLCLEREWHCFRGSRDDVLDRFHRAAERFSADVVVRVTADCPLVDPGLVDQVVALFLTTGAGHDYASNTLLPRRYPLGLDVEVFSASALARAWNEDRNPVWREHVTPFIYRNPRLFNLAPLPLEEDLSWVRWTVDYLEDLDVVRRLYAALGDRIDSFNWREALAVYREHPEWVELNRGLHQRSVP